MVGGNPAAARQLKRSLALSGLLRSQLKIGHSYAAVILPEPPPFTLTLTPDGPAGTLGTLRWPAMLGATLESSDSLAPSPWTAIPGPFTTEGTDFTWPVPRTPGTNRAFFRLRR